MESEIESEKIQKSDETDDSLERGLRILSGIIVSKLHRVNSTYPESCKSENTTDFGAQNDL